MKTGAPFCGYSGLRVFGVRSPVFRTARSAVATASCITRWLPRAKRSAMSLAFFWPPFLLFSFLCLFFLEVALGPRCSARRRSRCRCYQRMWVNKSSSIIDAVKCGHVLCRYSRRCCVCGKTTTEVKEVDVNLCSWLCRISMKTVNMPLGCINIVPRITRFPR
jgi:hypothetical protein